MVSLPASAHASPLAAAPRPVLRETWLILSSDDHGRELPAHVDGASTLVVAEPALFLRLLIELRPGIVVCAEPPADPAAVERVARERLLRPDMRAVLLAPPDAVARRLASMASGFDDALPTSVLPEELAGRLALLASRGQGRAAGGSRLPVTAELAIDLEAHTLRRNGVPVHLRPKEYALLALLASHPGRAFSRQELLQRVWGPERAADSRTVDVHVRWLRAKIEPDPEHAVHLVTVRGTGYRLDPPRCVTASRPPSSRG